MVLALCGAARSQSNQQTSRPGWPCVPGRAIDPTYIELSESTGGQLFLFQKGEMDQAGPVMSASFTHPATVLRAVGHFSGTRDLEFPVDSTVESLLVLVSVQCRSGIAVFRPSGREATDRDTALSVDLATGKILRVDQPEPGRWKVRISGNGLFVASVLAKSDIRLTAVSPVSEPQAAVEIRLSGPLSQVSVDLVDASGGRVSETEALKPTADGVYRSNIRSQAERYRVVVRGEDNSAWPFQRMHPVLFQSRPRP